MKSRFRDDRRKRRFMCRCRGCDARITLELRPSSYQRRYACRSCGRSSAYRDEVLRIDWYRTSKTESRRRGVCNCDAAPFHHRPGYGLFDKRGRRIECHRASIRVAA